MAISPPIVPLRTAPGTACRLRRLKARLWAGLLLLVVALVFSPTAEAHAILVQSTPAADGKVAGPHLVFSLRYNSRIDKARSRLQLIKPDKSQITLGIAPDGPEDVLTTTATLDPGAYTLRWQVLAIDGHITHGILPFTVTAGAKAP